jgi:hypothetical protein
MLPAGSLYKQHPYELANLRQICRIIGIELSQDPVAEEIQSELFGKLGKGKAFIENANALPEHLGLTRLQYDLLCDLLWMSGILDEVPPRTVYGDDVPEQEVMVLITSATYAWMLRRVLHLCRLRDLGLVKINKVYAVCGSRPCSLDTERDLPDVKERVTKDEETQEDIYPTEGEMLQVLLRRYGFSLAEYQIFEGGRNLDDNVVAFANSHLELWPENIFVVTNAAANSLELQVRRLLRSVCDDFDGDPAAPQFSFAQDGFPLMRDEDGDPRTAQRPKTLLSAVPRLVNELYLLNQEA